MHHQHLEIDVSEWVTDGRRPVDVMDTLEGHLAEKGAVSLGALVSDALAEFTGTRVHQSLLNLDRSELRSPTLYTNCLKMETTLIYVDVEPARPSHPAAADGKESATPLFDQRVASGLLAVEFDLFDEQRSELDQTIQELIESTMRCFGLTGSRDDVVQSTTLEDGAVVGALREMLSIRELLARETYDRVKRSEDRDTLIALKRRGVALETDLADLATASREARDVQTTLDFFSGEDIQLVSRRFALVCSKTGDMLFLLENKDEIPKTQDLLCPTCGKHLDQENIVPYYESTPALADLLNGSRWMPMVLRDSLVAAGVPEQCVILEAKHGEDEIDAIAVVGDQILVFELKDRDATLNDAYKLSAKTSRLEAVFGRAARQSAREAYATGRERNRWRNTWTPVLIASDTVAEDAKALLRDTRPNAKVLPDCEGNLDTFCAGVVTAIGTGLASKRFRELASRDTSDSVANMTAAFVSEAFSRLNSGASQQGQPDAQVLSAPPSSSTGS